MIAELVLSFQLAVPKLDLTSVAVNIAGHSLDTLSTYRFLHNGNGCHEGNLLIGTQPSTAKLVAFQAGSTGLTLFSQWAFLNAAKHNEGKTRTLFKWLSSGVGYYRGGLGIKAGITNFKSCGW